MDAPQSKTGPPNLGSWPARLLAGLQAGVLGAFAMAAWLMLANLRRGQPVWTVFNLISTALLGYGGLRTTLGGATLVGLSLHVVVAGLHGIAFATVVSPRLRGLWAAHAGVLLSLVSYAFFFGWALRHLTPMFFARVSRPAWLGASLLFGAAWGFYAHFARDLAPPADAAGQVFEAHPISSVESNSTNPSSTAP